MRILIRHKPTPPVGHSMPFVVSGWIHGFILAWIALSPGTGPAKPRSLYEQEIQPHEKRLIWYHLREKLPDINPAGNHKTAQPPRATERAKQTIVAGKKDLPGPRQLISMPAPEIKNQEALPLPNAVAVAPTRQLKPFTAPAPRPVLTVPATLAEAPAVAPKTEIRSVPIETYVPKPAPRAFHAPAPPKREAAPVPVLPDAPGVSAGVPVKSLPIDVAAPRAPRRAFAPPATKLSKAAPSALPDAPEVSAKVSTPGLPLDVPAPRAPRRAFTPPPQKQVATPAASALADAPSVQAKVQPGSLPLAVPDPKAPLRAFTPPPSSGRSKPGTAPDLPAAPEVDRPKAAASPETSLAIVGMNPVKAPDFPTPPGSRQAGFSAGPQIRPKGGDSPPGDGSSATIVVPGLLVRGGDKDGPRLIANSSPTSRENLMEAARTALGTPPAAAPPAPAAVHATRVSSAPDPRLAGRAVYTVAIQMPNITSYSGSWIVWFAEREPQPGAAPIDVRAPVPLRKVDPKYIAAAAEEKVEGVVRLSAVIRKDGTVHAVGLLRHLDDRLDLSAQEALAKWVFQPALRDGSAMDVDAVFEIPFHLAPKPAK